MADSNTSEAPASSSQTTQPAEGTKATNGPEYVTKAELEAFQKTFQESLQAQSNMLGGIRNDLKGLRQPTKQAESKTEDTTLTARITAIETREKAQRESLKFGSLKAAAMTKGVPERRAEQFARYVLAEHPEAIHTTDDFRVVFKESDDKTSAITDWASAFLQTTDGEMFLPPKVACSSDGQSRGSKATQGHRYQSMTYDQIMEDRKKNPGDFGTYIIDHAAEFEAKSKQRK